MIYEEIAKEVVDEKQCAVCDSANCNAKKCFWFIVKRALDKQIPKKPVDIEVVGTYKDGEIIAIGKCPVCFEHIGSATSKHGCCNCLQALDWSVEE